MGLKSKSCRPLYESHWLEASFFYKERCSFKREMDMMSHKGL